MYISQRDLSRTLPNDKYNTHTATLILRFFFSFSFIHTTVVDL